MLPYVRFRQSLPCRAQVFNHGVRRNILMQRSLRATTQVRCAAVRSNLLRRDFREAAVAIVTRRTDAMTGLLDDELASASAARTESVRTADASRPAGGPLGCPFDGPGPSAGRTEPSARRTSASALRTQRTCPRALTVRPGYIPAQLTARCLRSPLAVIRPVNNSVLESGYSQPDTGLSA